MKRSILAAYRRGMTLRRIAAAYELTLPEVRRAIIDAVYEEKS